MSNDMSCKLDKLWCPYVLQFIYYLDLGVFVFCTLLLQRHQSINLRKRIIYKTSTAPNTEYDELLVIFLMAGKNNNIMKMCLRIYIYIFPVYE